MELVLPTLPYDFAALEPHIDAQTMEIHHDKHHAKYLEKLLEALDKHPELKEKEIEYILGDLDSVPEDIRTAVRNNGGGFVNHAWFWETMSPDGGGEPKGELADALNEAFGSFAEFQKQFTEAATNQFGSGWAWLGLKEGGKEPHIHAMPNQDNPLMHGHTPILGIDVWEHAYYLKYQNKRPDYITAWWNVVNWDKVAANFAKAQK